MARLLQDNPILLALSRQTLSSGTPDISSYAPPQPQPPQPAADPMTQLLLQTLLAQQQQQLQHSRDQPLPEHTTRSGRVSRPPVAPSTGLEQVLQLAQTLAAQSNRNSHLTSSSSQDEAASSSSRSRIDRQEDVGLSVYDPALAGFGARDTESGPGQGRTGAARRWRDRQESVEVELPEWPLPSVGKGSRKAIPKEEIIARRKERNKLSGGSIVLNNIWSS
jgi:hypothetical protein